MGKRLTLDLDQVQIGFLLILFLSLCNGFFYALMTEYFPGPPGKNGVTGEGFLCDPQNLHADLIEASLSVPPYVLPNSADWPAVYRQYIFKNAYGYPDLGRFGPPRGYSILHVPPAYLLLLMVVKRVLLFEGPLAAVEAYYLLGLVALWLACRFLVQEWTGRVCVFLALAFSYPFLFALLRGNAGAMAAGFLIIAFIYAICVCRRPVAAALLLALACNFRPNAFILTPLLFYCGFRALFLAGPLCLATAAAIFLGAFRAVQVLLPGYSFDLFSRALRTYYELYVIGTFGNLGNNSAFGAFKLIYLFVRHASSGAHEALFGQANWFFFLFFSGLYLYAMVLLHLKKMSGLEFVFIGLASYMLTSTIFASYHLLAFMAIPLLFYRYRRPEGFSLTERVIFFTSVFLLAPKEYIFIHKISLASVLNPAAVTLVFFFVLVAATLRPADRKRDLTPLLVRDAAGAN